jgi:hypothetical protein
MNKFNEYDVVQTTRALSDQVQRGIKGTILLVFRDSPFQYEVEFFDGEESLGTLTVKETDLQRLS